MEEVNDALKLPFEDKKYSKKKLTHIKQNVVIAEKRKEFIRERRQDTSAPWCALVARGFMRKKYKLLILRNV